MDQSRIEAFREDLIYALGIKLCREKVPLLFDVEERRKETNTVCDVDVANAKSINSEAKPMSEEAAKPTNEELRIAVRVSPPINSAQYAIWKTNLPLINPTIFNSETFSTIRVVSSFEAVPSETVSIFIVPANFDKVKLSTWSGLEDVPKPGSCSQMNLMNKTH